MPDDIAAAAPAAEPQATPEPAELPKPLSKQERREQLIARLRGAKAEATPHEVEPTEPKPAPGDKPAEEEEPKPDAEKVPAEKPESDAKPEPKPDADTELKLASTRRELKNARADLLELKPLADRAKALEDQLAKAKEDPNAALAALKTLLGRDFGELTEWLVEHKDKITQQQKYADLPPDVREEIELARKERVERQERQKTEAEQAAYVDKHTKYTAKIAEHISTHEDEFPLSAAYGEDVAKDIARMVMAQTGPVDARALIAKYEADTLQGFTAALSNEKLVKHLLTKPELKATIARLVSGVPEPKKSPAPGQAATKPNGQPRESDTPTTLTNSTTSADTSQRTSAQPTREERKREIKEAFRRYRSAS